MYVSAEIFEIRSLVGRGMRNFCIYTEMTRLSPIFFLATIEGHLYVCPVVLFRTFFALTINFFEFSV